LTGFETGVVVMPLVKSDAKISDEEKASVTRPRLTDCRADEGQQEHLAGRIRNGKNF
jgi:hypothetical protein